LVLQLHNQTAVVISCHSQLSQRALQLAVDGNKVAATALLSLEFGLQIAELL
jgi:hypothetical protein